MNMKLALKANDSGERENMRQVTTREKRSPLNSYSVDTPLHSTHTHIHTHRVRTESRAALRGRERRHIHCTPALSHALYSPLSLYCHDLSRQLIAIPILQMMELSLRVVNLPKVKQFMNMNSVWVQRCPFSAMVSTFFFFLIETMFSNEISYPVYKRNN